MTTKNNGEQNKAYHLIIKKGEKIKEKGHFFKAAPFYLRQKEMEIYCEFKKGSNKKVVLALTYQNDCFAEYEHPFYVPDIAPELAGGTQEGPLQEALPWIFAAFVVCHVTPNKSYTSYFSDQELLKSMSFEVVQPSLYPKV